MIQYVFTGGGSTGKTTVLNALAQQGQYTLPETARPILDVHPHLRGEALERKIFESQLEAESSLSVDHPRVFLDRGIVDVKGYCQYWLGRGLSEFEGVDFRERYDQVFLFDLLPLNKEGRVEANEAQRNEIHQQLLQTYLEEGYSPILVPVLPVPERTRFVLDRVREYESSLLDLKGGMCMI